VFRPQNILTEGCFGIHHGYRMSRSAGKALVAFACKKVAGCWSLPSDRPTTLNKMLD
jgi:hypothetical protein